MVKAKDFWNCLCEKHDYRFFAGVICPGLVPLYKKMTGEIMHYVPAANERIALGLVSGAYMSGFNGGILIDMRFAYDLTNLFGFNIDFRIPFLVIGYGTSDSVLAYDFPTVLLKETTFEKNISYIVKKINKEKVPGLIVIEEGMIQ